MASDKEVCLITGVGPGTGSALARRFARGGYRVAMLARSADRLDALKRELSDSHPYPTDVSDPAALCATLDRVNAEIGPPAIAIHNAVGGTFGTFDKIDPADLERNFTVNVMALLHLARAIAPPMVARGRGVIVATGNTSAHRGTPRFAGFAPTKAAQRILAQSIARELGPKGVHVAYLTIDAVIDVPWAREAYAGRPDDFFISPANIAEEIWHVAHQPRSAWSFDVELRPFGETW
ncbi:MAG TPA: SDR family NAD(P)-dependent oxidoreductase [Acetobacteraceae bacterium]|nr:SDR family NAD(P)-dependent oxidoreductase [Acetobacteraceae bacterium]